MYAHALALTDLVFFREDIRLVHEYLEVQVGMLIICRYHEVNELLYGLLVESLAAYDASVSRALSPDILTGKSAGL